MIQRNQHFLRILIDRAGGSLLLGVKEMEDAKREKGAISVERLSSGVFRLGVLTADGTTIEKASSIDAQIQAEMNKIDWPEEGRIDAIGQNGNDGEHYGAKTETQIDWVK